MSICHSVSEIFLTFVSSTGSAPEAVKITRLSSDEETTSLKSTLFMRVSISKKAPVCN
ncbi:hypothetical protein D3C87_1385560 [compost metagenome]